MVCLIQVFQEAHYQRREAIEGSLFVDGKDTFRLAVAAWQWYRAVIRLACRHLEGESMYAAKDVHVGCVCIRCVLLSEVISRHLG